MWHTVGSWESWLVDLIDQKIDHDVHHGTCGNWESPKVCQREVPTWLTSEPWRQPWRQPCSEKWWYTILFFWDPGLYSRAYCCLGGCNRFYCPGKLIHYPHSYYHPSWQSWSSLKVTDTSKLNIGNHEYCTGRLNDRSFILLCPTFWIEYIHIVYYIYYNIIIFEYAWPSFTKPQLWHLLWLLPFFLQGATFLEVNYSALGDTFVPAVQSVGNADSWIDFKSKTIHPRSLTPLQKDSWKRILDKISIAMLNFQKVYYKRFVCWFLGLAARWLHHKFGKGTPFLGLVHRPADLVFLRNLKPQQL